MIELHHWEPNAGSLALLICLAEKDLEYAGHYVDVLKLEQHEPEFRVLSPEGIVPVLVTKDEAMTDTGLALQYLSDRYPEPCLAPTDPAAWYDLQAWTAILDGRMGLADNVRLLGWNLVMLKRLPAEELDAIIAGVSRLPTKKQSGWAQVQTEAEADEDQLKLARERVEEVVGKLEAALARSDWLVSDAYSIADILGFAHAHCVPSLLPESVNATTAPRVIDWLSRVAERDAVRDALTRSSGRFAPGAFAAPGT
jgi:glutathione S-transferase/GST-like protein